MLSLFLHFKPSRRWINQSYLFTLTNTVMIFGLMILLGSISSPILYMNVQMINFRVMNSTLGFSLKNRHDVKGVANRNIQFYQASQAEGSMYFSYFFNFLKNRSVLLDYLKSREIFNRCHLQNYYIPWAQKNSLSFKSKTFHDIS